MAKNKDKEEAENLTRTAFVITRKGYEYDDNYYNQSDSASPVKVYLNKERADEECLKQNIIEINGCHDLSSYSESMRYNSFDRDTLKYLVKDAKGKLNTGADWDTVKINLPQTATKEQVDAILEAMNMEFNSVEEIDLDMRLS